MIVITFHRVDLREIILLKVNLFKFMGVGSILYRVIILPQEFEGGE